jgi:phenylalanyl-tRNA synthetase beta chain
MYVSLSWLKEYVSLEMGAAELADALTMAGLEVDRVSDRYAYLETVVAGRVVTVARHPDADRLKVCTVDIGDDRVDVVCGAPNVAADMVVPCALPGTELPDGTVLEVRTVRGQVSTGMLCSAGELGLGDDFSGLMALDGSAAPGEPLASVLGLEDTVIEIDLTPNRPDCLSITGIAREVAAMQQTPLRLPADDDPCPGNAVSSHTSVDIQSPELCPRYAARLVFDVTVGPSPGWLQDRLMSIGLRPINNIVDVTNFVMMETGQPLHAFDFDLLAGHRIVVREAAENEIFVTLDQKERRLQPGMLLICDAEKAVALAGVMGGLNSEIQETTTRVLIESAYFNPGTVRKAAKKLGLNTDASHRFERGVDPQGTVRALNRAAELIAQVAGGVVIEGGIDAHPNPQPVPTVDLNVDRTNRLLGLQLTRTQVVDYLTSIEFDVEQVDDVNLKVRPPSFRVDVTRPEDLVEEVARLSGYNTIPTTFPAMIVGEQKPNKTLVLRRKLKEILNGFGFSEAINYSFISERDADRLRLPESDPRRSVVKILNPLTEDQAVMRTSMLPGLLTVAHRNHSRQVKTVKLFEAGKVFIGRGAGKQPSEIEFAAGIWTGLRQEAGWCSKEADCDFFDLKGAVEGTLGALGVSPVAFQAVPDDRCLYTRPGASAEIVLAGDVVGLVGEVHPDVLTAYGLKQAAFVFELDLERLKACLPESTVSKPLPKYPSTARDLTLITDKTIEVQRIMDRIRASEEHLVEDILLFDVYEGKPIATGKKSVTIRIVYRSLDRTLEDEFVNELHSRISGDLITAFDALLP